MDGTTNFAEDNNENTDGIQQTTPYPEKSREELLAKLVELIDNLFESNNIVNNNYLLYRALNEDFEVPAKFIYNEKSIRAETADISIINEALDNAHNVIVNKKGEFVKSVQPKRFEAKCKITIKNVLKEKKDDLRNFIYSLKELKEGACYWSYNPKFSVVTLTCKDEDFAARLFDVLANIKFNEEALDCSLESQKLYNSALEKKKYKSTPNHMNYVNPMYAYNTYNPYQMYPFFTPATNNFYVTNNYQNMNYYYPTVPNASFVNPLFTPNPAAALGMGMAMNGGMPPTNQTMNKKPYNPNYKNDKKPYAKQKKQFKEKNYQYNNKVSTKSSSVEVNDDEFPPL